MKSLLPPRNDGPRWARQLLTRLHPWETLEEVEGDMDELYYMPTGNGAVGMPHHQRVGRAKPKPPCVI